MISLRYTHSVYLMYEHRRMEW